MNLLVQNRPIFLLSSVSDPKKNKRKWFRISIIRFETTRLNLSFDAVPNRNLHLIIRRLTRDGAKFVLNLRLGSINEPKPTDRQNCFVSIWELSKTVFG